MGNNLPDKLALKQKVSANTGEVHISEGTPSKN